MNLNHKTSEKLLSSGTSLISEIKKNDIDLDKHISKDFQIIFSISLIFITTISSILYFNKYEDFLEKLLGIFIGGLILFSIGKLTIVYEPLYSNKKNISNYSKTCKTKSDGFNKSFFIKYVSIFILLFIEDFNKKILFMKLPEILYTYTSILLVLLLLFYLISGIIKNIDKPKEQAQYK